MGCFGFLHYSITLRLRGNQCIRVNGIASYDDNAKRPFLAPSAPERLRDRAECVLDISPGIWSCR